MDNFRNLYNRLEPGRYFYTIWVALPDLVIPVIKQNLSSLLPFCNWISTFVEDDDSKKIPHITLRYLGYEDEVLKDNIISQKFAFEKALSTLAVEDLILGDFRLWTRKENEVIVNARLNWEIKNPKSLVLIHNALLTIKGFDFFINLEGENYSPHISLGSVDLNRSENLPCVSEYLEKLKIGNIRLNLKDYAINLASKDNSKRREISLNV